MVNEAVEAFGHVDILYNNAGIMPGDDGSVTDISEATWDRILDINLKSAFLRSKYTIPHMVRRGKGSIINVASFVALLGDHLFQGHFLDGDIGHGAGGHDLLGDRHHAAGRDPHRDRAVVRPGGGAVG